MLDKILMLAGTVSAVLLPVFIGHGLAVQSMGAVLLGLGFGGFAGVLFYILLRLQPGRPGSRGGD